MLRSCLEFYVAKLFSGSMYEESAHISIYSNNLIYLYSRYFPHNIVSPTGSQKPYCCRRDQIKFSSCNQEFEPSTKYIMLLFSFAPLKLNSACVPWHLVAGASGSSFQNRMKYLLYSLYSLPFLYLFSSSPSHLQVAKFCW